jgi:hypothetical protein
MTSNVYAKTI